ncbi:helix-turn-helix transcriptional regulator [Pseudomonas sp. NPDC077408]
MNTPRFAPRPQRVIYRIQQITQMTGFTRAWIYRLIAKGEFPKGHKIGLRAVGWDSAEVDAWIAEKMGDRA